MTWENSCIAVCDDRFQAEKAMHLLQKKGLDANKLSIVGNDYPCEEYLLTTLEGAVVADGFSTLGAALYRIAIPEDNIIRYETAIGSGRYLLVVHGKQDEVERACDLLAEGGARDITIHLR